MNALLAYRDDGPLARALAPLGARVAPSLLAELAIVPLLVAIAAGEHSTGVVGAVLGWMILVGGASRGGDLGADRFRWAVPPLLRAGEYAALIWLCPPAGYFLLVVLAFRHYDLVYRLRYQGRTPPEWLGTLAGGWDGRLVVAWILWAADALGAGFFVLGGILGALFVAECVASWRSFSADDRLALYDEHEGDAE